MAPERNRPLSVAILAHNEADRISATLAALVEAGLNRPDDRAHVIVNGSTDGTAALVAKHAATDPRVQLHDLPFGDKSHAWNYYVYSVAPAEPHHIFLDGDVKPAPGAFEHLWRKLEESPEALATSALPKGGRRSESWAGKILQNHGLPGNLYALKNSTLATLKARRFFLPVGFVGDDTILRWILLRGLDPKTPPQNRFIQPSKDAFFEYESFPLGSAAGLRALYKRQRRYSRRDLETALLTDRLAKGGIEALPRYASELYKDARWTTTKRAGLIPRQVFAPLTVLEAKKNADRIPAGDPWGSVFGG